ncbi:oocyte zinc finger protein XlCOF7.1-like isoform X2 [Pseudophryne corroboree]|uniref:oocyte zinc finger protein XlCOF7.1-like isoform X2 n=1 Tax=Pseudophryne corroboree TaxID=495146 RepID=UPI0030818826
MNEQPCEFKWNTYNFAVVFNRGGNPIWKKDPRLFQERLSDFPKMVMEKEQMAEAILNHTLEIISLLTVEDYMIVKRHTDKSQCTYSIISTDSRQPSLSLTLQGMEDRSQKKLLELANKIIQILSSEVPIKCEDVAVYFSRDEWEYLEGHKEQYDPKQINSLDEPPLTPSHQRTEDNGYVLRHIKEEPDDGEYTGGASQRPSSYNISKNAETKSHHRASSPASADRHADDYGCISTVYVKLEPVESCDENTMDDSSAGSSQFPPSPDPELDCNLNIKKEADESNDSQDFASDDQDDSAGLKLLDGDQEVLAEIVYELTDSSKRSRKSESERKSPCDMCGKKFVSKASLARHVKTHTGDRPYPCPMCGKRFSCKNHVLTHQRTHTGERPFSCDLCPRKFLNHSHLVLHQVVHTREKPFSCPDCGKGFTRQSSVNKHIGIHAEKKPFVCKECGKSYCQYANLVVHQRLHSGEKPYTCKHCERAFICKATMNRHEMTHTKERPFPCPHCSKCFRDNATLSKHKRSTHEKK